MDIAKKTTLAKVVGLGGVKHILHLLFICNGKDNITSHENNKYDNGLGVQKDLIAKFNITLPLTLNTKGNNSIPILNAISETEYYKNTVIKAITMYTENSNNFDIFLIIYLNNLIKS